MISSKFAVKAKFIKKTPRGMTYFSITDFDSKNPKDPNFITVFATNDIDVYEDEKVKIVSIDSVSFKHWNGKPQVSINAKIEHDNEASREEVNDEIKKQFGDTGKSVVDPNSDLPF